MDGKTIHLTQEEIKELIDTLTNTIFSALAEKEITIDTNGVTNIVVTFALNEEQFSFNLKLMNRVTVVVEHITDDKETQMGFRM